jgi:D-3-phosphoglycerate dehydrogenase
VSGAAIDAFEHEPLAGVSKALAEHANVVCTPHIGASTSESQFRVARDIANYLSDALEEKKYVGIVNADALGMTTRRCVVCG